ncbi:MAG: hypothetical protein UX91_C0005G0055 [Candidatus Amesbacteria bacterium GW2011_GWB1_47_19]|nr:MAG: hypothetical protein UW51_C0007G0055 [Candidatus Amesbacteria bacterium GW2011_GWA1_44_24]KKU31137.1 MAG: hypothetical protein UX46_C0007G0055 [Candidatus Amesbacteria bacterium GW2011_GWC1_46_24]KKU67258.1 MAG: hypothetical protein UX91_C0005G0055 [Candidatus Amesbacteria bacterium GW2011_GWB1_47_19]OGD05817.1 MAG: hypothetical protein A2379_01740 [Candidatus Amesbacteria bacterium RIFOXYB1_FULL_47_13]HBC72679.1 hypothetical protein [Candidatus Amesbacteria bacterium]
MLHPDLADKIKARLIPGYLYRGQVCCTLAKVYVGVIHKLPEVKPYWKTMHYIYIQRGSIVKYLGRTKDLDFTGDVMPTDSVFEVVNAIVEPDPAGIDIHLGTGDTITLPAVDRRFVTPAPQTL